MNRFVKTSLVLALCACGGAESSMQRSPKIRAPIVNGTLDTTDTNVVSLYLEHKDGSGYLCSGSVVGPHSFVTAAHCSDGFLATDTAVLLLANDVDQALQQGGSIADGGHIAHVDQLKNNPTYHQNDTGDWNDIGMAHTIEAMPGPYLPLNRYPLDRLVVLGQPVKQVGYGETDVNGDGTGQRRSVTKTDMQVKDKGEMEEGNKGGLTCEGDSGGPTLFQTPDGVQTVIAVTSRGDQSCQRQGIDTRVDAYQSFIQKFMTDNDDQPSCDADGRCGFNCATPDPDCPCAPDGLCTAACTTPEADPDCPQSCLYDGGSCIPPAPASSTSTSGSTGTSGKTLKTSDDSSCTSASGFGLMPLLALGAGLVVRRRW